VQEYDAEKRRRRQSSIMLAAAIVGEEMHAGVRNVL
jgi:hypothetical protein